MSEPVLASLPPGPVHEFWQLQVVRYTVLAALAFFVWDFLINISDDYKLLFEHRIRLPTIVYIMSRLSCLGMAVFGPVVLIGSPTFSNSTCRGIETLGVIFFSSTIAITSLLFFFRTRAVFDEHRWIVAFFGALWLAVLGGSLAFIIHVFTPGNAPRVANAICINVKIDVYVALNTVIPLVNDTLVFLAITWRLTRHSYGHPTFTNNFRTLVFGNYLPAFSKALLQDGQAYYLAIVTIQLVVVIMLFTYSIPGPMRTILSEPNVVLMNVMACRVFRNAVLYKKSRVTDISLQLGFFRRESEVQTEDVTSEVDGVLVTQKVERTNA